MLSRRYRGSVDALLAANPDIANLDIASPDDIHAGQIIEIPAAESPISDTSPSPVGGPTTSSAG